MTLSTDGRMLWWDTRRLAEPSDELLLQNTSTGGRFGATSVSYNPSVGPTRYAGTLEHLHSARKLFLPAYNSHKFI